MGIGWVGQVSSEYNVPHLLSVLSAHIAQVFCILATESAAVPIDKKCVLQSCTRLCI